jgi:hypothetical protein
VWSCGLAADVLVHEALYVPGVDRLVSAVPNASHLRRSIQDLMEI